MSKLILPGIPAPEPEPPKPWDGDKRDRMEKRVNKAAANACKTIGAKTVLIVATFEDGEYFHIVDGGTSPMPAAKLYAQMLQMRTDH